MQTYYEVHDSIVKIPMSELEELSGGGMDFALDPGLVHLMETHLASQAKFWTLAIRNADRQLIACASLCLFQTDIMQSSASFLQKIVTKLRQYRPNILQLKTLFCGLPVPSGFSHLRFLPNVDRRPILILLNQAMEEIAKREGAQLLVVKEFNVDQMHQTGYLAELNYYRGELEPVYELRRSFKNFTEYLEELRAPFRRQVRANLKKLKQISWRVERIMDPEQIYFRFTKEVYQLYLNVWANAKQRLERFPIEFFRQLGHALPNRAVLTLIWDVEKPIAFTLGIVDNNIYYNIYTGLDYSYNQRTDLYFNSFYQELETAFSFNKKKICLGQTSGTFKSRLGAVSDSRYFWVRPIHPALKFIFKVFRAFIFPTVVHVSENQIFKT